MRDLLWFDPSAAADEPTFEPDPVKRVQTAMRKELPKRFWTDVSLGEDAAGAKRILLDGRSIKTPGKRELVVPRADLAEGIAAEWRAQTTHLDPSTMPLTRLANTVLDGVVDRALEVALDATKYADSDLLCYRAPSPERLVQRQTEQWDPILDWAETTFGARFLVGEGVMHVAQDHEALAEIGRAVASFDPWRLAGLHAVTTLGGSVLIALALAHGRLGPDEAWRVAHLDELWSLELWGSDAEAEARLARRRIEFDAAATFLIG